MSTRQLIVVDIESTGLDPKVHVPIEIAAVNVDTGEVLAFVPYLAPENLMQAEPDALRINRYFERGVYKLALNRQSTADHYDKLWGMLRGNTLAGANPRFDAAMLYAGFEATNGYTPEESWHHRLADVSAYVAGALGIFPSELPGLAECCKRLGVVNEVEHSALGDAEATAECFRQAMAYMRGVA